MTSNYAVVLDAVHGDAERRQIEGALSNLTRLGLVYLWDRLEDGRYRIEADTEVLKQLAALGWPQDHHRPAAGALTRQ